MPAHIDPDTGDYLDFDGGVHRTLAEAMDVKPPCPRCGKPTSPRLVRANSFDSSNPTELYTVHGPIYACGCWNPTRI